MNITKNLALFCGLILTGIAYGAENMNTYPQIINIENREVRSLNGSWRTIVDPFENGFYDYRMRENPRGYFKDLAYPPERPYLQEYDFNTDKILFVPGDWNTQRPQLYYYEGTVWYRKLFDHTPVPGKRFFLYFGAANYDAIVYLNGEKTGRHIGGFTPFNFEVTDLLREGENSLVVKVDNRRKPEAVPTVNSDWWNFGGITRHVWLVETPETFIRDYFIQLDRQKPDEIYGWVQLDGQHGTDGITVEIPELGVRKTVTTDHLGYGALRIPVGKLQRWSPDDPKLYDVRLSTRAETLIDRIGFRTIETRGKDILLNGRPVFCRGVCVHEETLGSGSRAATWDEAVTLLSWAKEMGCNFVRLVHYPHNENMVRAAEKLGLMVWSEIPVYWTIQWSNPQTFANAETQLSDMITRDKNRANVIIWSVANETPQGAERLDFLTRLIRKARSMDDSRLVSAAMEKEEVKPGLITVHDDLNRETDLVSFNQYVGWYDGTWAKCDDINWTFDIDKPVFVSEFGGEALYGNHGPREAYFTEEYLEEMYIRTVEMFKRIPGLAGTTPWVLKDFRSPRRHLPQIQDDFNRKGLVSDRGEKKKAFYVMQKWYREIEQQEKSNHHK